ncbi:IQEC3 protein, partial [Alcedo cyanopectus]|nr:IQEC3 protein [Ceyx cyanopectus]
PLPGPRPAPAAPPQGPPSGQSPPPPPPPGPADPLQHHQQLPAQQPPPPAKQAPAGPGGRAPGHQHPPLQPHQHPAEKDGREKGCCAALLQHKTPQAIGKGVLSRRPENEIVLHQFCCPAADAEQKPSSPDSSPSDDPSGSTSKKDGCETEDPKEAGRQSGQEGRSETLTLKGQQQELQEEQAAGCSPLGQKASLHHTGSPVRVQRSKGTASCSHAAASDYELSLDLKNKQIEMLEHKYGGHLVSRRAACTIQTAFRQYQLSKNFEKIRNSLLESRMPRRISLRKVRVQNSESFSADKALVEGYNFVGIPLVRSPSLPATISGALTELEDSFTEQVQSLAKSIDDALSTWSLKTMCSLQDGGSYQIRETFSASSMQPNQDLEAELQNKEKEEGLLPDTLPKSSSTLMMAFRDVTVQIDNKNISVSSSTSVSMANCLSSNAQAGLSQTTKAEESPEEGEGEASEPLPAPESLPEPGALQNSHTFTEVNVSANGTGDGGAEPGQMSVQKLQFDAGNETGQSKGSESENADNSEQMSSSSTSTSAKSASEVSSKEALQAMILSLPRYHCENPASCKSPTLSTDTMRKRLYRIGLNLFNM